MAKKYYVVVNDNGEEIAREEVVSNEKRSIKDRLKDFSEKHPKVTKGIKIGAGMAAVAGAVGVAFAAGRNSADDDYDYDYIPCDDNTLAIESLDVDDMNASETEATEN